MMKMSLLVCLVLKMCSHQHESHLFVLLACSLLCFEPRCQGHCLRYESWVLSSSFFFWNVCCSGSVFTKTSQTTGRFYLPFAALSQLDMRYMQKTPRDVSFCSTLVWRAMAVKSLLLHSRTSTIPQSSNPPPWQISGKHQVQFPAQKDIPLAKHSINAI